jgi:hypothetical protein
VRVRSAKGALASDPNADHKCSLASGVTVTPSRARIAATHWAAHAPWAALIADGVVLNKDGSLQRTARFRGPDLDSATPAELVGVTARLNNALRRLGTGWAIFVEASRHSAQDAACAFATQSKATTRPGARCTSSMMVGKSTSNSRAALPRARCRRCSSSAPRGRPQSS